MLETYCRPTLQRYCVTPLASTLSKIPGLTANITTVLSGITGCLAALSIAIGLPWLAIILLAGSGLLDMLDGTIARQTNHQTPFGCALDIMMDRLVEASVIVGLYAVDTEARGLTSLAMLSSILLCITSFLVVGIFTELENKQTKKGFDYSAGLIERAEAFIFFALMILLPSWFTPLAWLFTALVITTAIIRLIQFKQHSDNNHHD